MSYTQEDNRDIIKNFLKERICKVTFTKVDGTERTMKCTLNGELIAIHAEPRVKKTDRIVAPNEEIQRVFDLDQNAWRSFRWSSLVNVDAV